MKKVCIWGMVYLMFLMTAVPLMAAPAGPAKKKGTETPPQTTDQTLPSNNMEFIILVNSGFGMTISAGDIKNDGDRGMDNAYSIGLKGGVSIVPDGFFMIGTEFLSRQIAYTFKNASSDLRYTIEARNVMLSMGYRHMMSFLYAEGGLFYNIRSNYWTVNLSQNGSTDDVRLNGDYEKYSKNDLGMYLDGGFMTPVSDKTSLSLGLRFIIPFTNAYEWESDVRGNAIMVTFGCAYRI